MKIPKQDAHSLLTSARDVSADVFRRLQGDGTVMIASILENPQFGSATVFVQRLSAARGSSRSHHERRKHWEEVLFRGEAKLLQHVSGDDSALTSGES
jgi:hypothetical protein